MGALPKQRVSRHRRGNRRREQVLKLPQIVTCSHCGENMRSHHVCPNCGFYRERQVLHIEHRHNDEPNA